MPTYDYECTDGHLFEETQSIHDTPLKVCPIVMSSESEDIRCGAVVKRLINAPSFILKGSGWYKDGYSSSGAGKNKSKKK